MQLDLFQAKEVWRVEKGLKTHAWVRVNFF